MTDAPERIADSSEIISFVQFLNGASEWRGLWFGSSRNGVPFWWREDLRIFRDAARTIEAQAARIAELEVSLLKAAGRLTRASGVIPNIVKECRDGRLPDNVDLDCAEDLWFLIAYLVEELHDLEQSK